jgi:hypothetical protein
MVERVSKKEFVQPGTETACAIRLVFDVQGMICLLAECRYSV